MRQQKEEIGLLNKNLTSLYKELEAFSYSVSHDLRAPLRGIEGYAAILEEDYMDRLDDYGRNVVKTIISSAEEMEGLIEDLLSLGKLGKSPFKIERISLVQLTEEVLTAINVKRQYPSSVIELDEHLPEVSGDRRLLFQLLTNLIENALKYSAKVEKPQVQIGYRKGSEGVVFFVRDNGIGFDPVHKEKIFNVFSRLVKKEYSGSGVGLATAKKVVERHNGEIWIEAAPGKGATFYFTLGPVIEGRKRFMNE